MAIQTITSPTVSDTVGAIRSNHTAKATFKCSTSENKFQRKTNSRYRNTSSPAQNRLHPPVKIRNKFQSQSNHDSFNCRPSKSNPHSINQKSVIFGMHKKHILRVLTAQMPHRTLGMAPSHLYFHTPFRCGNPKRHHNVHRSEDMD